MCIRDRQSIQTITDGYTTGPRADGRELKSLQTDIPSDFLSAQDVYDYGGIVFCPHKDHTGVAVFTNQFELTTKHPNAKIGTFVGSGDGIALHHVKGSFKNLELFRDNKLSLMIATKAFGMGIDKPDVRIVIHMDLPDSIEAYFQEAGRAGRDGQKAYAVILYAKSDKATLHKRIPDTFPEKEYIKEVYEHLQYYYQMAMGDGQGCVREFNIEDFCRKFKYFPVPVDSALKILTQAGYLEYTDEQDNASRLLFTIRRDELYKLRELGEDMDKLIQTILRSYTGVFTDHAFINEDSLAIRTGLTRRQVYEQLIHLAKLHIVSYIPRKKTPYIIYTRERVEMRHLQISPAVYEERKERYEKRISAMLDYVSSDTVCRSRMLLHYFGEKNEHNCGQCDTCINLKNKKPSGHLSEKELSEKILQALSDKRQTPATLAEQIADDKNMLIDVLHGLLDEGKVIAVNGMLQIKK